jgi:hypothetical protein
MLDTTLSDAEKYPLKFKDCITYTCNKDTAPIEIKWTNSKDYWIRDLENVGFTGDKFIAPAFVSKTFEPYDTKVMSIDVSGSGSDETAYAVVGVKAGMVYLLDVGGVKGYEKKDLVELSLKAKEWEVNDIVIERNYSDGMFRKIFEPILSEIYPCTIYDIWSKGQKEKRIIDTLEPLTSTHRLILNRSMIEKEIDEYHKEPTSLGYKFIYQFTHISAERGSLIHDDRLDAVAMAVAHIQDMVAVNPEDMVKLIEKRRKEKEIEEFLKQAKGYFGKKSKKFSVLNF